MEPGNFRGDISEGAKIHHLIIFLSRITGPFSAKLSKRHRLGKVNCSDEEPHLILKETNAEITFAESLG